jgi:alpha-amylase
VGPVMRVVAAVCVTVSLVVAGCSSPAEPSFPTGRWTVTVEDQVVVVEFRADGTVAGGAAPAGQPPASVALEELGQGTGYSVSGDSVTFGPDESCGESPDDPGPTYTWELADDLLTLAAVDDECPGRRDFLDGVTFTRVEGASPAPPIALGDPVAGAVPWWNERVFYEVFVRSYADSDADGIGDLAGLISRLDHLNDGDPATDDDLGVTGLWLMPVMQSPSYHGYDTTDHYAVEDDYGTNDDYRSLVEEAHRRGMAVIVDLMLNHTSSEHPWFVDSARGPDSPKRDWYLWAEQDPGDVTPWSGDPAWHERNGAYYYGLFWEGMPDLNFGNQAVTEQMYDVARYWLEDMGADGFRLDAVRHLIESDGRLEGTPQTHAWLVAWDDHIDSIDPEALTIGEVWDRTDVAAQYVRDDEVDVTFEFGLAESLIASVRGANPQAFARSLADVLATYPAGQFAPFLTNHDQDRVMSQLSGDVAGAGLAATALLTLPGVPFLYYGEEIGMTGQKPDELIRTPMQWTAGDHAGFSTSTPWEAVNGDYESVNVAAQDDDPASLLNLYRRLVRVRAQTPALQVGGLRSLQGSCQDVYAHLRAPDPTSTDIPVLVLLNFARDAQSECSVRTDASDLAPGTYSALDLLADQPAADLTVGEGGAITEYSPAGSLAPRAGMVLALTPQP